MFNLSLKKAKVPDQWKISNITPIFKSGDPSSALSCRPISLLPVDFQNIRRDHTLPAASWTIYKPSFIQLSIWIQTLLLQPIGSFCFQRLPSHAVQASSNGLHFLWCQKGFWLSHPWQINTISCSYCRLWSPVAVADRLSPKQTSCCPRWRIFQPCLAPLGYLRALSGPS